MPTRRPKVLEIALRAGVSTATVDRVLNGRGKVSDSTVDRVRSAIQFLQSADQPKRHVVRAFDVILPARAGLSTEYLGFYLQKFAEARDVELRCSFVERMNPVALADRLMECVRSGSAGIAFQALEHPIVKESVRELEKADIPFITLLSDLVGVKKRAYVGIDNRAAGRAAALLMGRFCHRPGKIAIVLGGHLYRGHDERELGFRSILRSEFGHLDVVDIIAGNDSAEENFERVRQCATRHDLVGIYIVGGGIAGVARALDELKQTHKTCVIGHNLCSLTKRLLLNGTADAVIHQDMAEIAESALEQLTGDPEETALGSVEIPIEIVMRENLAGQFNNRIPLPSFESSLIQDREAENRAVQR